MKRRRPSKRRTPAAGRWAEAKASLEEVVGEAQIDLGDHRVVVEADPGKLRDPAWPGQTIVAIAIIRVAVFSPKAHALRKSHLRPGADGPAGQGLVGLPAASIGTEGDARIGRGHSQIGRA